MAQSPTNHAHSAKLVPRTDKRYQRAPGRNPKRRKSKEIDPQCCGVCSQPSRPKKVAGRIAKQLQQGVHAPELESEGDDNGARERRRLRITPLGTLNVRVKKIIIGRTAIQANSAGVRWTIRKFVLINSGAASSFLALHTESF